MIQCDTVAHRVMDSECEEESTFDKVCLCSKDRLRFLYDLKWRNQGSRELGECEVVFLELSVGWQDSCEIFVSVLVSASL
jgi:hypothetical protein